MDGKELRQPSVEGKPPKELGLKFSGKSLASPEHPHRNDDALAVSRDGGFAIVCDGMGGIPNGDKASRAARNFLGAKLAEISPDVHPNAVGDRMMRAIAEASKVVTSEAPKGGTTLTAVKFLERDGQKKVIIGHVGDSKCYLLREGKLIQITQDDRAAGTQNQLTNYLGRGNTPRPQIYSRDIFDGDKIIMASDGIENLTPQEIAKILASNPLEPAAALVQTAHRNSLRPGMRKDDISAIVVEAEAKQATAVVAVEQTAPKVKSAEYLGLLRKLESAVSKPLDPNTPKEVVATVIRLSESPDLGYSDAIDLQKKLSSLFTVTSVRDVLQNPQVKRRFFEAIKDFRRLGEIGNSLDDFREKASSEPDFFDIDKRKAYFWVNGADPPTYVPGSAETQKLITDYNQDSKELYYNKVMSDFENISLVGAKGWTSIKSKSVSLPGEIKKTWQGDVHINPNAGRIYLNAKPQAMDRVMHEMGKLFNEQPDVPFEAKMIQHRTMDEMDLNRADKMVLYFDPSDQAAILKTVQELYRRCRPEAFDKATPKFAAKLVDGSGATMNGIAFGQEPSDELELAYTFNNLREGLLFEMKNSLNSPDFEEKFRDIMNKKYKIDPSNPAFNLPPQKGKLMYPVILANAA